MMFGNTLKKDSSFEEKTENEKSSSASDTDIPVHYEDASENDSDSYYPTDSSSDRSGFFANFKTDYKTKRTLEQRHIQLIAIGGSIGTGLFVTIGTGLAHAGPGSLFVAFFFWTTVILLLTSAVAEMVCYLPTSSPFIDMAGRAVDEAFECAAGWNFFLMEAFYIPFEITACNTMIHFWRDDYSPAITFVVQIALYIAFNIYTVKWYGESEFYLSITKLILCIALLFFTFITMVGGNPQHDAFGFRNFNHPDPFLPYLDSGALGQFEGFFAAVSKACFVCVSGEYLSMVAGEAKNPRNTMKNSFKTVIYRLALFYIGGALSVGILVASNDPQLLASISSGKSDASASPYVIAIQNMGIKGLPSVVNVVIILSAFSAGNSYYYCASRQLYSLAKKGFAPKCFLICSKEGIPVLAVGFTTIFALLSLLQLGKSSTVVLNWIVSLCTISQILNYGFMTITYLCFYRALKVQGIDRRTLPYRAWYQPYSCIIAGFFIWCMVFTMGYISFKGGFHVDDFIFYYLMIFINIAIFIFWKLFKKTKFRKPEEVDLYTGLDEIIAHEKEIQEEKLNNGEKTRWQKIFAWIL